jgi:hypothetical protein
MMTLGTDLNILCGQKIVLKELMLTWLGSDPGNTCTSCVLSSTCCSGDNSCSCVRNNGKCWTGSFVEVQTVGPGKVKVEKISLPEDPQDFTFSTNMGSSPFYLDDDGGADPTFLNSIIFSDLVAGALYQVSEGPIPAGWTLANIGISGGVTNVEFSATGSTWDSSFGPGDQYVRFKLIANGAAEIKFTNKKCQIANAGPDKIICAGSDVVMVGEANYWGLATPNVKWTIADPYKDYLVWPYPVDDPTTPENEASDYKALFSPPDDAIIDATLTFTAYGPQPCSDVSDDVTVYIVEKPVANIRPAT